MTGDAGIPGQRAAVVPVGSVGTEDVTVSLSQAVSMFVSEADVYLRGHPGDDQGLVRNAHEGAGWQCSGMQTSCAWSPRPNLPRPSSGISARGNPLRSARRHSRLLAIVAYRQPIARRRVL